MIKFQINKITPHVAWDYRVSQDHEPLPLGLRIPDAVEQRCRQARVRQNCGALAGTFFGDRWVVFNRQNTLV